MRRRLVLSALCALACGGVNSTTSDMAAPAPDLVVADASATPRDQSSTLDLVAPAVDAPAPPDLAATADLAAKADLAVAPPDLTPLADLGCPAPRTLSFGTSSTAGPTNAPYEIVARDLSGDGHLDLVWVNNGNNTITVAYGFGDGTFGGRTSYSVGAGPSVVRVGHFASTTSVDLAVANTGGDSVGVLLNKGGTSGFSSMVTYATSQPYGLGIGDLDKDGDDDLTVANGNTAQVTTFLDNGAGQFPTSAHYAAMPYPIKMAAGDVNGDGAVDVALVTENANRSATQPVQVFLNDGTGKLGTPASYSVAGDIAYAVYLVDLDGNGTLDMLVTNDMTSNLDVYLNTAGTGIFRDGVTYALPPPSSFAAVSDFDGDCLVDIAVTTASDVEILRGTGGGAFATAHGIGLGAVGAFGIAAGDFNQDGKPDLAYTTPTIAGVVLNDSQ